MTEGSRSPLELRALYRISQAVTSTLDLERIVGDILKILGDDLGMQRGTLALVDPTTGHLAIEAAHGLTPRERRRGRYRSGEGITGTVLERGEPVAVPSIGAEPLFLDRTRARRELDRARVAFLCVPVKVEGRTVGVLSADRLPAVGEDLEEDLRVLEIVAGIVAQAVRIQEAVRSEKSLLARENERLRRTLEHRHRLGSVLGSSAGMRAVFDQVAVASRSDAPVLLTGEAGTGKSFVARTVHDTGARRDQPFVRVSCAAAPGGELEAVLFGTVDGGEVAAAGRGTLFLDHVDALPPPLQERVHHVIRKGGAPRVIAATGVDLAARVRAGLFSRTLYHRLMALPIHLPSLRNRVQDIPQLAREFLRRFREAQGGGPKGFTAEAVARLVRHPWPGNLGGLETAVWDAARTAGAHRRVGIRDLEAPLSADKGGRDPLERAVVEWADQLLADPPPAGVYRTVIDRVDEILVERALRAGEGVRLRAARLLGINRNTLYAKLDRIGEP